MKKYTVILPVHEVTEENKPLIIRAITSANQNDVDVMVVYGTNVKEESLPNIKGLTYTIVENPNDDDFCSQINFGIENVKTEWFSILELDDQYAPKWFQNVSKYAEAYSAVDVFLPVVADVDGDDKFLTFTNETLWALGFSNVQGELDNEALIEFQNFQISGAVYKTETVKKFGGLKNNLKLSFGYEFLLRLTHNNVKIMTIPKTGYKHTNMRTDSLFWKYKNDEASKLSPDEAKFWMDTARKEFYFTEQREIQQPV